MPHAEWADLLSSVMLGSHVHSIQTRWAGKTAFGAKVCIDQRFLETSFLAAVSCTAAIETPHIVYTLQGAVQSPSGPGSDLRSAVQPHRPIAVSMLPTLARWNMLTFRHAPPDIILHHECQIRQW